MRIRLLTRKRSHKTFASKLATELGIKTRFRKFNSQIQDDLLINWGSSYCNGVAPKQWFNKPSSVKKSIDKITCLSLLNTNNIQCLDFTTNSNKAMQWLIDGKPVYCRTLTRSFKGKGIVIANSPEEFVYAPLYTLSYPNNREYRYHVFKDKVFHVQEKRAMGEDRLKESGITLNKNIRNHDNGYIFCIRNVAVFDEISNACVKALETLDLDFAAFDVAANVDEETNELINFRIIESNTSPALVGTTFVKYTEAFKNYIEAL